MVTREQARDRGQLILIGAVLVALTIVASVVLLNSIHASADVRAQQDKQNLQQAERVTGQVQTNLNTLFVKNGTNKTAGTPRFIEDGNESQFGALVDDYNSQYLNLSSTTRSGFVDVSFDPSNSTRGSVVYQNETNDLTGWTLHGGPVSGVGITYLYMNITNVDSTPQLQLNGGSTKIIFEKTGGTSTIKVKTAAGTTTKCSGISITPSQPLEIELVRGVGEIRHPGCSASVDLEDEFESSNKPIQFPSGGTLDGTVTVISNGTLNPTSPLTPSYRGRETNAIIYPNFDITYQDPSVSYEANVTIRGDS